MSTVSKINLDGTVYDIQDTGVRQLLEAMRSDLQTIQSDIQTARSDLGDLGERLSVVEDMVLAPSFGEASWAKIAQVSASGQASDHWSIGDEKLIELSTSEPIVLQIYDFNHDDLTGGGKAGVTVGMKNLLQNSYIMDPGGENYGGITNMQLHNWLQTTMFGWLPLELQEVIKLVDKRTAAQTGTATININSMKLFLFSEIECFGSVQYSYAGEGELYPIFTDNESRKKTWSNYVGQGFWSEWILRSPTTSSWYSHCAVGKSGNRTQWIADELCGVNFGFCV